MNPRCGRRAPLRSDTMVIPYQRRFPYGNDVAAAGRLGTARAPVRGRARHFAQWPRGRRAARVSGRAEAGTSRCPADASAGTGHSTASAGGTRATTTMRPRRVAGRATLRFEWPNKDIAKPRDDDGRAKMKHEFPAALHALSLQALPWDTPHCSSPLNDGLFSV